MATNGIKVNMTPSHPGDFIHTEVIEELGLNVRWSWIPMRLSGSWLTPRPMAPDHKNPHSIHAEIDALDLSKWQPLCGRHQVIK